MMSKRRRLSWAKSKRLPRAIALNSNALRAKFAFAVPDVRHKKAGCGKQIGFDESLPARKATQQRT
jgi:hypothetical protein